MIIDTHFKRKSTSQNHSRPHVHLRSFPLQVLLHADSHVSAKQHVVVDLLMMFVFWKSILFFDFNPLDVSISWENDDGTISVVSIGCDFCIKYPVG